MCIEFSHREKDCGACGMESDSLHASGSFGGGPWALRPKRLQWLKRISTKSEKRHNITAGFKIAAFLNVFLGCVASFLHAVTPAKAEAQLSTVFGWRKLDSRLRGNDKQEGWGAKPMKHSQALSLTANYHFTISICGLEAMAGTSPPFFFARWKVGFT